MKLCPKSPLSDPCTANLRTVLVLDLLVCFRTPRTSCSIPHLMMSVYRHQSIFHLWKSFPHERKSNKPSFKLSSGVFVSPFFEACEPLRGLLALCEHSRISTDRIGLCIWKVLNIVFVFFFVRKKQNCTCKTEWVHSSFLINCASCIKRLLV